MDTLMRWWDAIAASLPPWWTRWGSPIWTGVDALEATGLTADVMDRAARLVRLAGSNPDLTNKERREQTVKLLAKGAVSETVAQAAVHIALAARKREKGHGRA